MSFSFRRDGFGRNSQYIIICFFMISPEHAVIILARSTFRDDFNVLGNFGLNSSDPFFYFIILWEYDISKRRKAKEKKAIPDLIFSTIHQFLFGLLCSPSQDNYGRSMEKGSPHFIFFYLLYLESLFRYGKLSQTFIFMTVSVPKQVMCAYANIKHPVSLLGSSGSMKWIIVSMHIFTISNFESLKKLKALDKLFLGSEVCVNASLILRSLQIFTTSLHQLYIIGGLQRSEIY